MRYVVIVSGCNFQRLSLAAFCIALLQLNEVLAASPGPGRLRTDVISDISEACHIPGYSRHVFRLEQQLSDSLMGDKCVNIESGKIHCPVHCEPLLNASTGNAVPPFCIEAKNVSCTSSYRLSCRVRQDEYKNAPRVLIETDDLQGKHCPTPGDVLERHTGNPWFGDVCRGQKMSSDHCPLTCELNLVDLQNKNPSIAPPYCIEKLHPLRNASLNSTTVMVLSQMDYYIRA
jgi:hypothetical protein